MLVTPESIVGRERELNLGARFVEDIARGPGSLVLHGEAGIGKTSIWNQLVNNVRSGTMSVLTCRCGESDAAWAFAGLGDLFSGLDYSILFELPAVQQRALRAALLLADESAPPAGDHVVGVAVLGVLRLLSRRGVRYC